MNYIKRALYNVKRQTSKTILLSLTFFLIANFIIVGLGINNAAKQAKLLTQKNLRPIVTISFDWAAASEKAESIEDQDERNKFYESINGIKETDIIEIMKDSRVKGVDVSSISSLFSADGLQPIKGGSDFEARYEVSKADADAQLASLDNDDFLYLEGDISLKTNSTIYDIDIIEGRVKIVDGNFYTQEDIDNLNNVAVISKELAELNNLTVGSSFSLYAEQTYNGKVTTQNPEFIDKLPTKEDFKITYRVIGIYEHSFKLDENEAKNEANISRNEQPGNRIYAPNNSNLVQILDTINKVNKIRQDKLENDPSYHGEVSFKQLTKENLINENHHYSTFVFLNDATQVTQFASDYEGKIPYTKINTNNSDFIKFSKPLDTLSLFSNFIIWLVVINATVIITLVTALTLKTREYELGVLLSLGASKIKIVAQFFIELLLVALIGFSLACVSGTITSKHIGNKVLELTVDYVKPDQKDPNEIIFTKDEDPNVYRPYVMGEISNSVSLEEVVQNYNVVISPVLIVVVYVIGMLIVLVSVLIPSMMIMRYNPKKILMNIN